MHHRKIRYGVTTAGTVLVGVMVVGIFLHVHALSDIADTWNFATPGNYSLSNGLETSGSSVRLGAYELPADANTTALYNFNNVSGSTISDNSSNSNTLTALTGTPQSTTGHAGNGLSLNGSTTLTAPDSTSLSMTNNQSVEAWTKLNSSFSSSSTNDQYIADKGSYKLYFDHNTGKLSYELADGSATTASSDYSGPGGIGNSVNKQIVYGSDVYYIRTMYGQYSGGTGGIWHYNGTTVATTQVGSSYTNGKYVNALVANGSTLYIGIGDGSTGTVYSCDMSAGCNTWTAISSAFSTGYGVTSLFYQSGHLYAGTYGSSGTDNAALFVYNSGTSWTRIGGTGSSPTSWTSSSFQGIPVVVGDGSTALYVGLGDSSNNAQIWKCVVSGSACSSWTLVTSGWKMSSLYTMFTLNMTYFGGNLYAINYNGTGGEVRRYSGSGTTWTLLTVPWSSSTGGTGALTNDGSNLYVAAPGHIYKCATPTATCSTWADISNTTGTAKYADANSLVYSGSTLYAAGKINPENGGYAAKYAGGAWTGIATPVNWGSMLSSIQSTVAYNGTMYAGVGNKIGESTYRGAGVYRRDGASNWTEIGGNGVNNSWNFNGGEYNNVNAMVVYGGKLYVALGGLTAGDGEVWRYDGTSWTKVGGDGMNSSWNTNYEGVYSLSIYNGQLYAGTGNSAGDASVWRYDGTSWTKVGGDGMNSSWATSDGINTVSSMTMHNGTLYAGLGNPSNPTGKVYAYNGSSWTQIAGYGAATGNWSSAYDVTSLVAYNGQIYAGLQTSSTVATIWRYNGTGTSWTQVAGGGLNGSWTSQYKTVAALVAYNGQLYAGLSVVNPMYTYSNGALYAYNGSTWSNAITNYFGNGSYGMSIQSMQEYNGKLWFGTGGYNDDGDGGIYTYPMIYTYGANAIVQSSATSWDTSWHKVGASYDGSTMKLYVDGSLVASNSVAQTVPDYLTPLVIGKSLDGEASYLNGTLDDLRLSNIARASFPALSFTTTAQTVTLAAAVRQRGVWHWDDWADSEVANNGTITYRLSIDGGITWQYWNGSVWTPSSDTTQANDVPTLHSHIATLPVTFGGITWQAILKSDGTQQVTLNSVTLAATSDHTAPTLNASAIQAKKAVADSTFNLASNSWTNGASPYFSWTAGSDTESGIGGYCLYFGQDNTADPVTTKGMLGTSPTPTGNNCQFLVSGTSVDLGTAGYLNTPMVTSNTPYYLVIKAMDKAGNPIGTTTEFHVRFDNTPPTNPAYITAPSGFINTKDVALTWPATGANGPADANSGVAGLQYKINNSNWYGDAHSGTGDFNDLLTNDGTYSTLASPDYGNLTEGLNTIYFRTWDATGNVSATSATALVKLNTTGAPSTPLNLAATPSVGVSNSFAFTWDRPVSLVGDAANVTYCYSVNTLPNSTNCTYTSAGATTLPAGPFATQPGINTFYLVARDESHNINYDNYATVNFTANTPAPGIPLNADVADVSIKSTHNWRLALTWDTPADVGSGNPLYKVYRSTDGVTFAFVGSSSSTSYIDANLTQQTYHYRVVACDSANNCSANSTTVSGYPTGKFTAPATLVSHQPIISDITTRKATINWSTDRTSDSKISMGTTSGIYDPPETLISDQVTNHQVQLTNLSAGTTYYIVAKWTDEDGNTGHSQEVSFTTSPAPVIKEVTTSKIGLSDATIGFTSLGAYRVSIYYGLSDSFGGIKSINTAASQSDYALSMDGLNDGTKYFYQPIAYDSEGNAYPGNIFSFSTPPRPRISLLQFQPVSGEPTSTQDVTWQTNVSTDSTVTYGVVGSTGTDITEPAMITDHKITINGLMDNSEYFLIAQSRDVNGNLSVSDKQFFHTALDTRPPKISGVSVETSIRGTGSQARGQIVVSWNTDELATSQVAYGTGTAGTTLNSKTTEDGAYSTEHIVIISDLPTSELYSVQPLSKDRSANQAYGSAQTAIIGRGSDDILTIVLNTLQKMFGF